MNLRPAVLTHVLSILTLLMYCSSAFAQPPGTEEADTQPPGSVSEIDATAEGEPPPQMETAVTPKTLREQSIYIPYSKLRDVFESEGRGVFLPYEQFQELWKAARASQAQPPEQGPPVAAVITEIESEAVVEQEVVRVQAEISIEVLSEGWTSIPLRLQDASILSATLDGEPARITHEEGSGYQLLVHAEKAQSEPLALTLTYAKAFEKTPGRHTVSFAAPQAPVNRWKIRVPQPGVKIDIRPLIAATEVSSEETEAANEEGEESEMSESILLAFVGAAPSVEINWTPESAGASGLEALTTVTAQQDVTFDEGLMRTQARLQYQIERAELAELEIAIPNDQKVVNVFDANVRSWEVESQDDAQRVHVQLFEPIRGAQPLVIELEKYTGEDDRSEVTIPVVTANMVARQHGVVTVHAADGLRVETVRRQGVLQIDTSQATARAELGAAQLAYRFASVPFELVVAVEKIKPRIEVEQFIASEISPERISVDLTALYHIRQAGVFQLRFKVPVGFADLSVVGLSNESPQATPVEVEDYTLAEDGTLLVNLARKAQGDVAIRLSMSRSHNDANLRKPTGDTSEIEIPIPRVDPSSIERESGQLVVHAPESLQVNPASLDNLREIPLNEPQSQWGSIATTRFTTSRRVLAYAFSERAPSLAVSVERRQPHVTVAQLLVAQVEVGLVRYTATLKYDIRYSGVESLRVDIPQALVGQIRNTTGSLREQVIDPPPEDLQEGYVAWRIRGDSELIGLREVRLEWEQPIERLEVGSSVDLPVPVIWPMNVDRAWGQIVVTKTESLDVVPAEVPQGLRPIDPSHDLMPGSSVPDAAAAFEFHHRWSLVLKATHYEPQPLAQSSIERSVVRMVVTRGGQTAVQALYRVRSRRQRLTIQLPSGAEFDTQPLKINGRTSTLEQGGTDTYFVPLAGFDTENPVIVELRYTVEGTGSELTLPEFPEDSAVLKTYLCVHAPEELALLGFDGPWTDEMRWQLTDHLNWSPQPRKSEADLVRNWLIAGLPVGGDPLESFPTDGQLYLFSALQPGTTPDAALRMTTVDERGLKLGVLLAVLALGMVLIRRPLAQRLAVFALLGVVCILLGVLAPTFSRQVVDSMLLIAVGVVLLFWLAYYLLRQRPRQLAAAMASAAAVVGMQSGPSATAAPETPATQSPVVPADSSESPPPEKNPDESQDDGSQQGGGPHA